MDRSGLSFREMPANQRKYVFEGQVTGQIGPRPLQDLLVGKSQKKEMMANFEGETPNNKKRFIFDSKMVSSQEDIEQEYTFQEEMPQDLAEIFLNYHVEQKKIQEEEKERKKYGQKKRIEKRCRLNSKNGSRQEGIDQEDASLRETSQMLEKKCEHYDVGGEGKMDYRRKKRLEKKGRLDILAANRLARQKN